MGTPELADKKLRSTQQKALNNEQKKVLKVSQLDEFLKSTMHKPAALKLGNIDLYERA